MAHDPALPNEFDLPLPGVTEGIGELAYESVPVVEPLDVGEAEDPAIEFRKTLGMFATGVTIITTKAADGVHGMTANAFMSVSLDPPLVLISVDRRAKMHRLLHVDTSYGVSVLGEDQHELSDHFAGRPAEAEARPTFALIRDTPLLEGAVAHIVARVSRTYWGGDHSLFLGRVEYARYAAGKPLLFHGGQYGRLPDA